MTTPTIDAMILQASRSAGRALALVALYVAWLVVSWLGPGWEPAGGWTLASTAGALAAYSLFTVFTLTVVIKGALAVVRSGALRHVVSEHVAPFWALLALSGIVGAVVFRYGSDSTVAAAWLGLGTGFSLLVAGYAWARILELRQLYRSRRQVAMVEDLPAAA